jgi:hypothetical protein
MKPIATLLTFLFIAAISNSQTVVFQTKDSFTNNHLEEFYSSFSIKDDMLVFSASDYNLYAYNKNDGSLLWTYDAKYKSNYPPKFVNNNIWINTKEGTIELDAQTGNLVKKIPISSIETKPFIKGDILYATGIVNGGSVFAYDLKNDSILWSRFIAHGCSRQPYYFEDRIVANAEGDKWLDLNYDGTLKSAGCDSEEASFPSELPCARTFEALSHDKKEIVGIANEDFRYGSFVTLPVFYKHDMTFVMYNGQMKIYKEKLKTKTTVDFSKLVDETETTDVLLEEILDVDEKTVTVLFRSHLIVYDFSKKKLLKKVDLSEWQPHQVIMENSNLHILSSKDGRISTLKAFQ